MLSARPIADVREITIPWAIAGVRTGPRNDDWLRKLSCIQPSLNDYRDPVGALSGVRLCTNYALASAFARFINAFIYANP
jgi:hypothetical protein